MDFKVTIKKRKPTEYFKGDEANGRLLHEVMFGSEIGGFLQDIEKLQPQAKKHLKKTRQLYTAMDKKLKDKNLSKDERSLADLGRELAYVLGNFLKSFEKMGR